MKKILSMMFLALPLAAMAATRPAAPTIGTGAVAGFAAPSSTQHYNAFTFQASADSTTANPGTTNLYRASGACKSTNPTSTGGFAQLQTGNTPSATSAAPVYDTAVKAGDTWSYVVTATIGGLESGPSNCVTASTPTFPVGGLAVTSN